MSAPAPTRARDPFAPLLGPRRGQGKRSCRLGTEPHQCRPCVRGAMVLEGGQWHYSPFHDFIVANRIPRAEPRFNWPEED